MDGALRPRDENSEGEGTDERDIILGFFPPLPSPPRCALKSSERRAEQVWVALPGREGRERRELVAFFLKKSLVL